MTLRPRALWLRRCALLLLDLRSPCKWGAIRAWDLCALTSSGGARCLVASSLNPVIAEGARFFVTPRNTSCHRGRVKFKMVAEEEHKNRCCEDH